MFQLQLQLSECLFASRYDRFMKTLVFWGIFVFELEQHLKKLTNQFQSLLSAALDKKKEIAQTDE